MCVYVYVRDHMRMSTSCSAKQYEQRLDGIRATPNQYPNVGYGPALKQGDAGRLLIYRCLRQHHHKKFEHSMHKSVDGLAHRYTSVSQ